jgi:WD40 repeat protein
VESRNREAVRKYNERTYTIHYFYCLGAAAFVRYINTETHGCRTKGESVRVASSSKDGTVKIWDAVLGNQLLSLSSHTMSVTAVKWGGEGLIYSASQDRSIKVWTSDGKLCRSLEGHGHWVNSLALSTDYVLRTGAYDHTGKIPSSKEEGTY